MVQHLVDIDESALTAANAELGTRTIKDTVNTALRRAGVQSDQTVDAAFDTLAATELIDRNRAWR